MPIGGQVETEKDKLKEKGSQDFSFRKEIPEEKSQEKKEQEALTEIRREAGQESTEEKEADVTPARQKEKEVAAEPAVSPATPIVFPPKTALHKNIEQVLEEDLEKVYFSLNEKEKEVFKKEGEKTASKIEKLLLAVKVKTGKVLDLIKKWLRLIPGINKYFLEQEAKIKTDKILNIKNKTR